jgi:hypothetical protein
MTPTRLRWLVTLGVVCAVAMWLLLRHFYATLPPLPWTPVPTLLLLGLVEAWAGRGLRARLAGQGRPAQNGDSRTAARARPLTPIAIARTAALAKASAQAAAVIAGLAAGFLLYLAGSLGKSIPRGDAFASLGTFVGAIALVAGALYLERSCRVPQRPDQDDPSRSR